MQTLINLYGLYLFAVAAITLIVALFLHFTRRRVDVQEPEPSRNDRPYPAPAPVPTVPEGTIAVPIDNLNVEELKKLFLAFKTARTELARLRKHSPDDHEYAATLKDLQLKMRLRINLLKAAQAWRQTEPALDVVKRNEDADIFD